MIGACVAFLGPLGDAWCSERSGLVVVAPTACCAATMMKFGGVSDLFH
jgi:hypothetical protein